MSFSLAFFQSSEETEEAQVRVSICLSLFSLSVCLSVHMSNIHGGLSCSATCLASCCMCCSSSASNPLLLLFFLLLLGRQCKVDGIEEGKLVSVTRCGFSGEDGFEVEP